MGGGGLLFLLLCCGDKPGEAGSISSPIYELRLSREERGDVGRGGDIIGTGGGTRLLGDVSALDVSTSLEGCSDISSSDSEPWLGETMALGGGGGGSRADHNLVCRELGILI